MPVPRHSRATGDKTLAAHRAALPLIQTAKRGRPPFGKPRDTTNAGRIVRFVIPACVLRIVYPSLYGTAPRFSFSSFKWQFERYHTSQFSLLLNSHFSILNCSVRGRHGAHCAPLRTHAVGAAILRDSCEFGRPPAAPTSNYHPRRRGAH